MSESVSERSGLIRCISLRAKLAIIDSFNESMQNTWWWWGGENDFNQLNKNTHTQNQNETKWGRLMTNKGNKRALSPPGSPDRERHARPLRAQRGVWPVPVPDSAWRGPGTSASARRTAAPARSG